jgi:hypothetical protein
VTAFSFTLTEHDPEQPWIVRHQERRTVELDDGVRFFEWARKQWPAPRWTVELDPWQLSPRLAQHRPDDTTRSAPT